ncbi:MAG: hypothetical protein DRP66_01925 [Planctomycetota bacterium]|nr:MAG: hypothetical protein DRP66_01925 [Planctomycetota bacterium]
MEDEKEAVYAMNKKAKHEKILAVVFMTLLLLLCALAIFYGLCGKSIIEAAYEGKSIGFANNLIKYQHTKPVEHYLELADVLFYRGLFLGAAFLGFTGLVVRLIFFRKPPHAIWAAVFGTFVILGVHLLNPNNRIYSSHGFMHAGIVYQILNGNIPPLNPLLAGMPLLWPWGHHFLAAVFVKILNISPAWAFVIINVLSLQGIVFLVYKTSKLIINDQRANVLSVIISIFAVSFVTSHVHNFFEQYLGVFVDTRITPVFSRFTNSSGVPLGLLFYLLFIYTVLLIFNRTEKWRRLLIVLLISIVGTGFFYFQMLPGLLGGFGAIFLFRLYRLLRNKTRNGEFKLFFTTATVGLGCLILLPYALSLTGGVRGKIDILNPSWMWRNFTSIFFVALPILTLILIGKKRLGDKTSRLPMWDFVYLTLGVSATYISLHFPAGNEYKYLGQAMVLLGILGGITLSFYCNTKSKYVILLLMLIPTGISLRDTKYKLRKKYSEFPYRETGKRMLMAGEEGELYEWLLKNTPKDTMVIDTELTVPVLAQRSLFIAEDKKIDGKIQRHPGFSFLIESLFTDGSGYGADLLSCRYRIRNKIYDPQIKMNDEELVDFFQTHKNVVIVIRDRQLINKFSDGDFDLVFSSSGDNFKVYRPVDHKKTMDHRLTAGGGSCFPT